MTKSVITLGILTLLAVASTGCSVSFNGVGALNAHSSAVGSVWHGTDVEMTPGHPDHYTGELRVDTDDGRSGPNGYGVYSTADGEVWEGTFKDGSLDGHGIHRFSSGWREEGEWKDGLKNGRIVQTDAKGWREEGVWKDGKRDGLFIQTDASGTHLEVEYKDDNQIRGKGTLVYDDKTRQTGTWNDVLGRGEGTIDYPDGRHYQGQWRNMPGAPDLPDGEGTMTWPDGKIYTGQLRDGQPHGFGKMTAPKASTLDGYWQNGAFVKPAARP